MIAKIKSRAVSALKIVDLEPLYQRSQLRSIAEGVLLRLENGASRTWLAERDGAIPEAGFYFIEDAELGTSAVVAPAEFVQLFDVEDVKAAKA